MKENDVVRYKPTGELAVMVFPSKQKQIGMFILKTLNVIQLENGDRKAVKDEDIELVYDFNEE